ncbi:universal stress protein (plasmid) [Streptomyces mirabilis]|uniref:universal stress protein n=1 Tax=Streptomyces mirabilis TaxID=68239 RepID=UPI001BB01AA0|nr:universal stress protein [Streptomyces mirabilis]QUW85470.1 universal stress protein [Streptomyces mirabilis]
MEAVVTAGLDGSPESLSAARWAADEAVRRGLPLRLIHAWVPLASTAADIPGKDTQRHWAHRILRDAESELRELHPGLPLTTELASQDATAALLTAGAASEMLVLGSRGIGPVKGFFLGDIGLHVVARADRPVVLVRADERQDEQASCAEATGVVVGLSLRRRCEEVLEFAFGAAARRGTTLRAVHCRTLPVPASSLWSSSPETAEAVARALGQELGTALRPWQEKFPGVRVIDEVTFDSAARAMASVASGSALLVVGRRRDRPALAPGIGPVTHAAIHHAPCPVAVVTHD